MLFKLVQIPRSEVTTIPETTDDFIRNFLIKFDLKNSFNAFQNEWYFI